MNAEQALGSGHQDRARKIAFVFWVTLVLNWGVAALKVLLGTVTHCLVITVDGIHSFFDGSSNVVSLIAMRYAVNPADLDHPYGHQKYEALASVVISMFLVVLSLGILREAVMGFWSSRQPEVYSYSFYVMAGTFFVNLFVVWYERKKGRELQSDLLASDSWHTLTDIFVTLSVIVALVGIRYNIPHLDSIFSIGIVGLILWAAVGILKNSANVLCDRAVLDGSEIEAIVKEVAGVLGCHEVRTRGQKHSIYVDLHVLVDNQMTVLQSHDLAHRIEKNIKDAIRVVQEVVVHVEPVTHEHH